MDKTKGSLLAHYGDTTKELKEFVKKSDENVAFFWLSVRLFCVWKFSFLNDVIISCHFEPDDRPDRYVKTYFAPFCKAATNTSANESSNQFFNGAILVNLDEFWFSYFIFCVVVVVHQLTI